MKKSSIYLFFSWVFPVAALILSIIYNQMIVFSIGYLLITGSNNYAEYKIAKLSEEDK